MNSKVIYGNVTMQDLEHFAVGPLLHIGIHQNAIDYEDLKKPMVLQEIEDKAVNGHTLVYWYPSKFCIRMDKRTGRLQRMPGQKLIVELMPADTQYWHIYWGLSMVKNQILGFSNSYALESAYTKYKNGKGNNPFDPELILSKIAPYAISVQDKAFDITINENIVPIDPKMYALEKEHVFNNFTGPDNAIKHLSRFTKKNIRKWYIPEPKQLQLIKDNNVKSLSIVRSDAPVDQYLLQSLLEFINFNNYLMKQLYEKL